MEDADASVPEQYEVLGIGEFARAFSLPPAGTAGLSTTSGAARVVQGRASSASAIGRFRWEGKRSAAKSMEETLRIRGREQTNRVEASFLALSENDFGAARVPADSHKFPGCPASAPQPRPRTSSTSSPSICITRP